MRFRAVMTPSESLPELSTQFARTSLGGPSWTSGLSASLAVHGAAVVALVVGSWASNAGLWQSQSLPSGLNSVDSRASALVIVPKSQPIDFPEMDEPVTMLPPAAQPPSLAPQTPPLGRLLEPSVGALPPSTIALQESESITPASSPVASHSKQPIDPQTQPLAGSDSRFAMPRRKLDAVAVTSTDAKAEVTADVPSPASVDSVASQGAEAPPQEVFSPAPAYPPELLAAKISGLVKLRVRVNDEGQVIEASLHKSSGYPAFDREALKVIQSWRFAKQDSRRATAREFVKPLSFRIVQ